MAATDNTDEFSNKAITVKGAPMPAPRAVVTVLRENLYQLVLSNRTERGEVRMPEDTYDLVRSLTTVREGAAGYEHAFATIRREVDGYIQDDLELAVGEQDGVPNSGMKVPDVDGTDIAITVDTQNNYGFDTTALVQALVFEALSMADEIESTDLPRTYVAWLLDVALNRLIGLGQFRPQITKVRAFADDLSRREGGPAIASTVMSTVTKTPKFKGIKVERKQPR